MLWTSIQEELIVACHAQGWVEDVSSYIKSIDPNHLVLLGHSGIFGASTPDLCA